MPPKGKFPREHTIVPTRHQRERSTQRVIPQAEVDLVIRTGSARPEHGKGVNGGVYVRFSKVVEGRTVVVIAEILGQQCFVLTTYEQ